MNTLSIADALFTKTQQRVLGLLYGNPGQSFYTNEIVRIADMGNGTITRELERLAAAGLLAVSRSGNQRHYQANVGSSVYKELVTLIKKTSGVVTHLQKALQPISDKILFAFVYGSMAKSEETPTSGVDLLLVSDSLSYSDVLSALIKAEKTLGRKISPTIYTEQQFNRRLQGQKSFLASVMNQPKLWVLGVLGTLIT